MRSVGYVFTSYSRYMNDQREYLRSLTKSLYCSCSVGQNYTNIYFLCIMNDWTDEISGNDGEVHAVRRPSGWNVSYCEQIASDQPQWISRLRCAHFRWGTRKNSAIIKIKLFQKRLSGVDIAIYDIFPSFTASYALFAVSTFQVLMIDNAGKVPNQSRSVRNCGWSVAQSARKRSRCSAGSSGHKLHRFKFTFFILCVLPRMSWSENYPSILLNFKIVYIVGHAAACSSIYSHWRCHSGHYFWSERSDANSSALRCGHVADSGVYGMRLSQIIGMRLSLAG